jgi:hypothetical protein
MLPGTGKAGAKIVVGKFIRLLKSKQGFFSKSDSGFGQKKASPTGEAMENRGSSIS